MCTVEEHLLWHATISVKTSSTGGRVQYADLVFDISYHVNSMLFQLNSTSTEDKFARFGGHGVQYTSFMPPSKPSHQIRGTGHVFVNKKIACTFGPASLYERLDRLYNCLTK